ncbi:MAG: Hpt domain-containing protein [Bacteriovoracaceae bacterium]|nr:Hpt domain-containing protein [Bacteriovoracaceae bacterium]
MQKMIDYEQFNEAVDHDQDVIEIISETFLNTYEDLFSAFKSSVAKKDVEELSATAHTLKGAVSMFFVENITKPLQEIESAAKSGSLVADEDHVAKIEGDLKKLAQELQEILGS